MSEQIDGGVFFFDGPDGAGKTTQIDMTKDALEAAGYDVYSTRVHGGTPIGEALRVVSLGRLERTPQTDLYISLAMHSTLTPDLDKRRQAGEVVLVDRSPLAIWAYQIYGDGLASRGPVDELIDNDYAAFNPTLTICYLATLKTLRARMIARHGPKADYYESKGDDYFGRVIEGYQYAAARYGALVIDAERHQDVVHAETRRHIFAAIGQTR